MKYTKIIGWSVLCLLFLGGFNTASAIISKKENIELPIKHYSQEKNNYCPIAIVQMWAEWKGRGKYDQSEIYRKYKKTGGFNWKDMEKALEYYVGHKFQRRSYFMQENARARIVKELLKQERPLAICATTRKKNGNIRPAGHWMLISGARIDVLYDEWGENTTFIGAYMKDPLHGSGFEKNYHYLKDNAYVSSDDLFKKWWKKVNVKWRPDYYACVED